MNHFSRCCLIRRTLLISCLFVLLPLQQAFADARTDARSLASSGKLAEALVITEKFLDNHPNDASMLFLKGVILTQQEQNTKAIAVFTQLTEKHPSLPEPYNNLAALHAANGQYDKARAMLEAGMRTNPAYATTYENLGAVYAKLASQAYEKALHTNINRSGDKTKLALVHALSTDGPVKKVHGTIVAAASAPATPVVSAPVAAPPSAPTTPAAPATPAKPADAGSAADRDAVGKTLNDWAAAWSNRDVKKYLGFYANDFKIPGGKSRKAWAEERRARIAGKSRINVKVESPQITISGNTATVKFRQAYKSDRLSTSSRKTMVFIKSNGQWKIQQELSN